MIRAKLGSQAVTGKQAESLGVGCLTSRSTSFKPLAYDGGVLCYALVDQGMLLQTSGRSSKQSSQSVISGMLLGIYGRCQINTLTVHHNGAGQAHGLKCRLEDELVRASSLRQVSTNTLCELKAASTYSHAWTGACSSLGLWPNEITVPTTNEKLPKIHGSFWALRLFPLLDFRHQAPVLKSNKTKLHPRAQRFCHVQSLHHLGRPLWHAR